MASRRGGYSSLPIDAEEAAGRNGPGAEQQQGGEAAGPPREVECTPEGKGGSDAPNAGASGSGGGKDSNNTTAAEKSVAAVDKTDLTGGLPTAEGVFVGDPVTQSTGYHPVASGGGGGAGGFAPSAPQATVITAAPPPTYQNHVVAAAAVAAMGGDGRGIAVPASGGGHHTVIVMNGPPAHQFGEWGRAPQPIVCRACGYSGLSATHSDPCSNMPILAAACCCLIGLWPCSFIPFLIPDLRDTVHRCPNCQLPLGRSRQFQ